MSISSVLSFEDRVSWRTTLVLIVLAWLVAVGLRFVWIADAKQRESWQWNGHCITNNRDSYLFGCILQKAHLGMHQENTMVPGLMDHGMITACPYLLLKILPLSIDGLLIHCSVFVSALICVPVVLIGRLYGTTIWGFLAALLAGNVHSYYNRTMAGYYDTDMVSVTVPTVALFFLLAATRRANLALALAGGLTLFIYPLFYHPGLPVGYAVGLAYIAYRIAFHWRQQFTWSSIVLVSLALACARFSQGTDVAAMPWRWPLLLMVLLAAFGFLRRNVLSRRALVIAALLALTGFVLTASPVQMMVFWTQRLQEAQQRGVGPQAGPAQGVKLNRRLHFLDTLTTVRETARIPARRIADRIVGSQTGAVVALVGYVVLCCRYREMLIALPFVGMGIFAYIGGLRFTIYAVPIAALSAVYLLLAVALVVAHAFKRLAGDGQIVGPARGRKRGGPRNRRARPGKSPPRPPRGFQAPATAGGVRRFCAGVIVAIASWSWRHWPTLFAAVGTLLLLVPNVKHIVNYRVPVILQHDVVAALDALGQTSDGQDFVITWWDYGSAAWYYSGCQTLNSPASNTSPDNFLISKIFSTSSQRQAANLCREAVEKFVTKGKRRSAIQAILRRWSDDPVDPDQFLARTAAEDYSPPEKTREVHLFIPIETLRMFPAIYAFGNRNLLTGESGPPPTYQITRPVAMNSTRVVLQNGLEIDLERKTATVRGKPFPLKAAHVYNYGKNSRLNTRSTTFDSRGRFHLLYVPRERMFLLMDEDMFHSALVQMFLFEKYDASLFEPVDLSAAGKLYRLKI